MKTKRVKLISALLLIMLGITMATLLNGCATPAFITDKSGAQLWGESCRRCHNAPSPTAYTDEQWQTIGLHMKTRALLTDDEMKKIIQFLQSAN